MKYRLKEVVSCEHGGYRFYKDGQGSLYNVKIREGNPDPKTWAIVNEHGERDMDVFTKEFCEYMGLEPHNGEYDTVTIIN